MTTVSIWAFLVLLLVGCAPTREATYLDTCTITQHDKQGAGVTTGTFACRLQHQPAPAPKGP